jgi:CelD/BcsL family acetyltransferase involved in cellulose biosynthesis
VRSPRHVLRAARAPVISVWPPLPPGVWARPAVAVLPYPLEEPNHRPYAFARQALAHGVRALGLGGGDEVLMPAYNHGSEVEALLKAGMELRFYLGAPDLAPVEAELDSLLSPRTRALYLIHYFGFPQAAQRWRAWCDERGLLLIEDAAQAWLAAAGGRAVGSWGDLAVFSLYKTFGLGEGAALVSAAPPPALTHDPGADLRGIAEAHALWLAQRSGAFGALAPRHPRLRRQALAGADPEFDSLPWSSVAPLVRRLAGDDAAAGRRINYGLLLEELRGCVWEPFDRLPAGASPFVFPLRAADKGPLLERLAARGIRALDLWPAAHQAIPDGSGAERRATTVGLPVHQELRLADLDRIVDAVTRRGTRPAALRVERVEALEALRGEWDELAERARNPFATWEWISTWWQQFGAGRALRVLACRDAGGRLMAIVPAFESGRRPVPTLRFIGHGAGDRVGPICAPADVGRTARALSDALERGLLEASVLVGDQLPAELRWGGLLGGTSVARQSSPVLDIDGVDFDGWLASRSRNFREQVRRRERRLAKAGALRYRLCEEPDAVEQGLETLFALHAARWGDDDEAFLPQFLPFHRTFARLAGERGWLRLWILELDETPVAAWEGFRYAGADWYYQSGRDPAFDRLAVGFVLLAHTVRDAMTAGMRTYCLGRGDEEYKRRFADRDPGLENVVVSRGATGGMVRTAAAVVPALPRGARRRLARLAG